MKTRMVSILTWSLLVLGVASAWSRSSFAQAPAGQPKGGTPEVTVLDLDGERAGIPVVPFACSPGCDGCATGDQLDRYIALRQQVARSRSRFSRGVPSVSAVGGLIVLEDDGTFTDSNDGSVWDLEDTKLVFVPEGGSPGFFQASRTAATTDTVLGTFEESWPGVWGEHEINLPFSFPFGESSFSTLHVTSDLGIFFAPQSTNSSGFQYSQADLGSSEARITPLLRDSPWIWADILDLYVKVTASSVLITWHEQSSRPESQPHLDRIFQVLLDDTGRIEMSYPDARTFNTFGAVQVIAPGPAGSSLTDLSTLSSTPTQVRFAREAFTLPTLLPFEVETFVKAQYGFDDDNLDALAIYQNHYTEITSYAGAYHTNGRPGATGIGRDGAKQTSLLHMNQINLSWNLRDDGSKVSVLSHEIGHRWLYFVDGVGASRAGAHPAQNAHLPAPFPWYLANDSSCMGGTTWTDNMDGTFTTPPSRTYYSYSWIELYLMGLASPAEVTPWWYVDDPSLTGPYYPPTGTTYTAPRVDLTVGDVTSANGVRSPAYPATQNVFRVALVLLTRPENPATPEDLANVRSKTELWVGAWATSVSGRASLETELPEIVGTGPLDCNFNGIADADDVINGTDTDCNGNGVLDGCEILPVITLAPQSTSVRPGESLFYDIEIRNDAATAQTFDVWIDAIRPGGVPYAGNPIIGPRNVTLNPGASVQRTVRLRIPGGTPAPSGPFMIRGALGQFPGCTSSSSSFSFTVDP